MKKVMFIMAFVGVSMASAAAMAAPTVESVYMNVNGLVCDFCAQSIKKIFGKHDTVTDVDVSLKAGYIQVGFSKAGALDDAALTALVNDAGYALITISRTEVMTPAEAE